MSLKIVWQLIQYVGNVEVYPWKALWLWVWEEPSSELQISIIIVEIYDGVYCRSSKLFKTFFKLLTPLPMQASFVKYYLFSGLLLRHGYGMDICFR